MIHRYLFTCGILAAMLCLSFNDVHGQMMDLEGTLRVGNDTIAAPAAGTIRYNSTSNDAQRQD